MPGWRMIQRAFWMCGLLAGANAWAGINSWTMTGPDAGAVYAMAIHPTNSQIAIVSTARGLYRTIDGANSWTLVNEHLFETAQSIAFDPTNPDRVFAARGALWRSDNAGQSFAAAVIRWAVLSARKTEAAKPITSPTISPQGAVPAR